MCLYEFEMWNCKLCGSDLETMFVPHSPKHLNFPDLKFLNLFFSFFLSILFHAGLVDDNN